MGNYTQYLPIRKDWQLRKYGAAHQISLVGISVDALMSKSLQSDFKTLKIKFKPPLRRKQRFWGLAKIVPACGNHSVDPCRHVPEFQSNVVWG